MKCFHGEGKKFAYFKGWYFKHQRKKRTICFIPGIQRDQYGGSSAFIQVITNSETYYIEYPYESFEYNPKHMRIKIGENIFSTKGVKLNIHRKDLEIQGKVKYGHLTPIAYNIMGPLRYLPFMKCSHDIISMAHSLDGKILMNGKTLGLNEGKGYIESDYGKSFPKTYFWAQCNDFKQQECSIVAAVADLNVLCLPIRGCFAVIQYQGQEYRLASYLGAKVILLRKNKVCITQGKYTLYIQTYDREPQELKAPQLGTMNRTIYEDVSSYAHFRFYYSGEKVFDLRSSRASVEYVGVKM